VTLRTGYSLDRTEWKKEWGAISINSALLPERTVVDFPKRVFPDPSMKMSLEFML
jgi:hypothetical protein